MVGSMLCCYARMKGVYERMNERTNERMNECPFVGVCIGYNKLDM